MPGAILAIPLLVWVFRRGLGRIFPGSKVWGVERPALETFTAILAFAPAIGWLGNPAWWLETLPRLSHYYTLSTARQGVLPDIQIIYFGQLYEFSLPWHNAFVLMAITVPVLVLGAGVIGVLWGLLRIRTRPAPVLFPPPPPDAAGGPDVSDPGSRWRPAVAPVVLLPVGVRGLGDGLAGGRLDSGRSGFLPICTTGAGGPRAGLGRPGIDRGFIRTSCPTTTSWSAARAGPGIAVSS